TLFRSSAEHIGTQLNRSLTSSLCLAQAALSIFSANGYGRIVNIVASAAVFGARHSAIAAAAGAGLLGFSRAAALDYAEGDICINGVSALLAGPNWREPGLQALTQKPELFTPERFAASIGFLADPRCTLSGRLWSATGARVAQCFTSTVPGHYLQTTEPTEVMQQLAAITDNNYAMTPEDHSDELLLIDI
ncbi:MAG: SDR family oxidoreductase, partial [Cellvibrionaceae bacterium]|nr:SDR family oxidoreductase [Cellvibrionaceae bacterium]